MTQKDFINCPRFGGYKPPNACLCFDRYVVCRRKCKPLEDYVEDNPESVKAAIEKGKLSIKEKSKKFKMKKAGKELPNPTLRCPFCKEFVAKSIRGLKSHCTRTHKKKFIVTEVATK